MQREAINQAVEKGLLVLTGGPGTGKTTTLNAIIEILEKHGEKVDIAAPTGRAAKRLTEITGREAKTIHRLLEAEFTGDDRSVFARDERNPLDCDALIVDELSMTDSLLFESLLKAVPMRCRLIMVGDSDQLPSVGAGNVLHDLIASGVLPVVQLKEVFRQAQSSAIVINAHKIVSGQMPDLALKSSDFFFITASSGEGVRDKILELCTKRLPAAYNYDPLKDIQVLAPGKKGAAGTIELNLRLQELLNPPSKAKKEHTFHQILLREGDKVMQIKNNYDINWQYPDGKRGTGVYNGDIGILMRIDRASSTLLIRFDDKDASYSFDDAQELDLAYAMTVHKSQGSEFEAVVMPVYNGPPQLYFRNLLYTAVTRARSLIILVGTQYTVKKMVDNNKKTNRYSGLNEFLTLGEDDGEQK
jgi:exodeoxyribonuclease V alpha subunit